MTILSPIDITLLTTNVAETDYPAWAVGTTYALEDKVVYSHKVYESLISSNVGNQPDTNDEKWMLIGGSGRERGQCGCLFHPSATPCGRRDKLLPLYDLKATEINW